MKMIVEIYCGKVLKVLVRYGYNRDFMKLYICATARGYELMTLKMLREQYEQR